MATEDKTPNKAKVLAAARAERDRLQRAVGKLEDRLDIALKAVSDGLALNSTQARCIEQLELEVTALRTRNADWADRELRDGA